LALFELGVAELAAGLFVRMCGMALGQVHCHVDVVAAGGQSGLEDRWVETRIRRVQDHVGPTRAGQFLD